MQDVFKYVKFEGEYANTVFAKNLLFYNKKKKDDFYLVIAGASTETPMRLLEKYFKLGKDDLRMVADADLL